MNRLKTILLLGLATALLLTVGAILGRGWLIGASVLAFALVAPLGASMIQLAISRSREYLADEGAARLTMDPEGLAQALERLERLKAWVAPGPTAQPTTASLMISAPFSGQGLLSWFSTHPPMTARGARLRRMTHYPLLLVS